MRSILSKISPEKDVAKLKTYIPRTLASAIPDQILYEHGTVGECNDLIFGFSLVDYATAKALPEFTVPKIIRICTEEIDKRGLESEGIYRVCFFFLLPSVMLITNFILSRFQADMQWCIR